MSVESVNVLSVETNKFELSVKEANVKKSKNKCQVGCTTSDGAKTEIPVTQPEDGNSDDTLTVITQ